MRSKESDRKQGRDPLAPRWPLSEDAGSSKHGQCCSQHPASPAGGRHPPLSRPAHLHRCTSYRCKWGPEPRVMGVWATEPLAPSWETRHDEPHNSGFPLISSVKLLVNQCSELGVLFSLPLSSFLQGNEDNLFSTHMCLENSWAQRGFMHICCENK